MARTITKQMTLAEVLEINPGAARVLLDEGMSCVGCSVARMETLEEGASAHDIENRGNVSRGDGEAAFATAKLALHRDDLRPDIGGGMDDDGAHLGIAVARIEPDQAA